jgi:hypothetical protein
MSPSGPAFHAARPLDGPYLGGRFLDSAGSELEVGVQLAEDRAAIQKMQWAGSANPPRLTFEQWAVKCGLKVNIGGQFEPVHPPRVAARAGGSSGSTGGGF